MFSKKGRFLSFEKEKWSFTTFVPLETASWLPLEKSTIATPGNYPSDVHGSVRRLTVDKRGERS